MFSWGNTVNGELGLGGIEDNHILSPTEITNFKDVCSIKSGIKYSLLLNLIKINLNNNFLIIF